MIPFLFIVCFFLRNFYFYFTFSRCSLCFSAGCASLFPLFEFYLTGCYTVPSPRLCNCWAFLHVYHLQPTAATRWFEYNSWIQYNLFFYFIYYKKEVGYLKQHVITIKHSSCLNVKFSLLWERNHLTVTRRKCLTLIKCLVMGEKKCHVTRKREKKGEKVNMQEEVNE